VAKIAMMDNLKDSGDGGGNWLRRAVRFLTEVRSELGRVTWPTRREVWATTVVVILMSMFFGIYLYVVDLALSTAMQGLIKKFGG